MAKRVLEESESINIELMIQSDSLAKKKSCKEKHDPESKEYQRSAKVVNGEKEIDTKELRKERKQLKKVKKLGTGENFDNESTVQPLSLGDTSVKNTRKAEKAKRKAVEQGQEQLSRHSADDKLPPLVRRHESSIPNGSGLSYTENATLKSLDQVLIDGFIA